MLKWVFPKFFTFCLAEQAGRRLLRSIYAILCLGFGFGLIGCRTTSSVPDYQRNPLAWQGLPRSESQRESKGTSHQRRQVHYSPRRRKKAARYTSRNSWANRSRTKKSSRNSWTNRSHVKKTARVSRMQPRSRTNRVGFRLQKTAQSDRTQRIVQLMARPARTPGRASRSVRHWRKKVVGSASSEFKSYRARCAYRVPERSDCSGWIRCVYSKLGLDVMKAPGPSMSDNGVVLIQRYVKAFGTYHRNKKPALGDLVFWHYTYDKNKNGLLDDMMTHIGLVEEVEDDGRITILHFSNSVKRIYMHLGKSTVYRERIEDEVLEVKKKIAPEVAQKCERAKVVAGYCQRRFGESRCKTVMVKEKVACASIKVKTRPQRRRRKRRYRVLNSYLLSRNKRGRVYGRLTGQLFAGFGTVLQSPLDPHLRKRRSMYSALGFSSKKTSTRVAKSHKLSSLEMLEQVFRLSVK